MPPPAKRVLLTGAGGFVGANLARRLLGDGHDVHAAVRGGSDLWRLEGVRGQLELLELDLRDGAAVRDRVGRLAPEWVFHLAAHGAYSWQRGFDEMVEANLLGTMALLQSALDAGCEAFVGAGSSSEYGFKDHAPSEDEGLEPNSHYAITKAGASTVCRYVARRREAHVVTLRLYSVYGPWEEPGRLLPTLIATGLEGGLPPMVDPETARDFVHVDDVVEAFLLAASAGGLEPGAIYNVGSGVQVSMRELVALARRLMGVETEPEWGSMESRAWDTTVWVADPARIRRELGWQPRLSLEGGLGAMIEWVRESPGIHERYRAGRGGSP